MLRGFAPVVFDGNAFRAAALGRGWSERRPARVHSIAGTGRLWLPVWMGFFLKFTMTPQNAKSDGANALDLKRLKPLLENLLAIHAAAKV